MINARRRSSFYLLVSIPLSWNLTGVLYILKNFIPLVESLSANLLVLFSTEQFSTEASSENHTYINK